MARVLALHLDNTLALPPNENQTGSIDRHLRYKEDLDYYCIITKTYDESPRSHFSPRSGMDVWPTNSTNRYSFLYDTYQMAGEVIETKNIDAITVQDWRALGVIALLLRKKYGVAVNLQLHNQVFDNPYYAREGLENWVGDKMARFVIPRGDTYWVGTTTQKERLKRDVPEQRIVQVPFSIPGDEFYEADGHRVREDLLREGQSRVVLWVGRMIPQKDLTTLIDSFAQVVKKRNDVVLWLVGDGEQRKKLEEYVSRKEIAESVLFCGYIEYQNIPKYYSACDIVCMSSVYEGTCRTIHEGMAAGKPVVSTNVDGALDAIQEGTTGHIVEKRSPSELTDALQRLLGDEEKCREMGKNAQENHKKHLTLERHCREMVRAWEITSQLTHQRSGGTAKVSESRDEGAVSEIESSSKFVGL